MCSLVASRLRALGQARGIDGGDKDGHLLIGQAGRCQIAEQFDEFRRRDADLLAAFARGGLRSFAGLGPAGHDLDEVAIAVGKMRRQAKLADHHDLTAREVDRQHRRHPAGTHDLARLHRPAMSPGSADN